MKKRMILLFGLLLIVAGCGNPQSTDENNQTVSATVEAEVLREQATVAPPPTFTPVPTATPAPTPVPTLEPTATPEPTNYWDNYPLSWGRYYLPQVWDENCDVGGFGFTAETKWPLDTTSGYDEFDEGGLIIKGPMDGSILATDAGVVVYSGPIAAPGLNMVALSHGGVKSGWVVETIDSPAANLAWVSYYVFSGDLEVSCGDVVAGGTKIGKIGPEISVAGNEFSGMVFLLEYDGRAMPTMAYISPP